MKKDENIISACKLTFSYEINEESSKHEHSVLSELDIDIKSGTFTAVLGRNGSGKSTFARHINGILCPTDGVMLINGMDTKEPDKLFCIRQTVGMVFQNPDNQIVAAVVEEDVAFGLENMGVPPEEIRKRVDEALKAVGIYEYREHSPGMLSGGQKQRVAIAGIIAMRPQCIVLDEPTAMLDPAGRKDVINIIKKLNREFGITIVLITHYMEEAVEADRVIVMDKGRVILDNEPGYVFSDVEAIRKAGLDVPQVTELIYELNKSGLQLDPTIITESDCIDALKNLLKED